MFEDETTEEEDEVELDVSHPLVEISDMPEEMRIEVIEIVVSTLEKYLEDELDQAATQIKQQMENKYGKTWHVVIGESYGFEVAHAPTTLIQIYVLAKYGVTVWSN